MENNNFSKDIEYEPVVNQNQLPTLPSMIMKLLENSNLDQCNTREEAIKKLQQGLIVLHHFRIAQILLLEAKHVPGDSLNTEKIEQN